MSYEEKLKEADRLIEAFKKRGLEKLVERKNNFMNNSVLMNDSEDM